MHESKVMDTIFGRERVNSGRQREIDLLKAYSIIMMIITHCIDDFSLYEEFLPSVIIDDMLAQTIGAQAFMICMGLGIVYARKAPPAVYAKRGLHLLIVGQALNLVRYGIPSITAYLVTGRAMARAWAFLVFSSDILQFAGLFFLCMALFRRWKLSPRAIFLISIGANILGMLTCMRISTGNYAIDQLLGMVVFTETESYFPLLHWMIFPAFGILFGDILQHVMNKKAFYIRLFFPCTLIYAVYLAIGVGVEQQVFRFYYEWQSFCYVSLWEALIQLCCCMVVISGCYFITEKLSESAMRPINYVSKNINRFYCVHSVMVYAVSATLTYAAGGYFENPLVCYGAALVIILATSLVVWIYDRYLAASWQAFFGAHKYVWAGIVIILSILVCAWSAAGSSVFPNLMNDYIIP